MTSVLTEFSPESINRDLELYYIKKFNDNLQPLLLLAPKIINNSYGYGSKMDLSETDYIACYGDSYMNNVIPYFSTYYPNKIFNNYTISGVGTSNSIIKDILSSKNIIINETLANRQSILFFGLYDIFTAELFYNSSYGYGQNLLALFLPLLIPYNRIIKASNITTKNGAWALATGVSPYAQYTVTVNNYLEHTITNSRYIAISWCDFRFDVTDKTLFNVYINNVLASTLNKDIILETNVSGIIHSAMVIDTGTVQTITVKIVAGNSDVLVISYIAGWSDAHIAESTNKKKLLVCYNNFFPRSLGFTASGVAKESWLVDALKCAVNSCKRVGLPIGFLIPQLTCGAIVSGVPAVSQNKHWAEFIINNGCY